MGLWDTVLSRNDSGHEYKLSIPTQFLHVAQAVAMNEHRGHGYPGWRPIVTGESSWGAFPLESIIGITKPENKTRIERGFIGSHADIGGGYKDNSLSKVPLAWMIEQARLAGVKMSEKPIEVKQNPVLHDKSENIRDGRATGAREDRTVHYTDKDQTRQLHMPNVGLNRAEIEKNGLITYTPRDQLPRYLQDQMVKGEYLYTTNETGTVNMKKYKDWLSRNGYQLGNLSIK